MADAIPFGQPILVGHHSEKRDRNFRSKIHNTFSKAFEANEKAAYYKQRAETLLNGTAISSDDPNAIDKLQDKLEKLESLQELMKLINKVCQNKKLAAVEKVDLVKEMGVSETRAAELVAGDRYGRIGFPSYKLTNNGACIRNTKDRIAHLSRMQSIESSTEEINGVTLEISQEDNRVQMFFPEKPCEEIRTTLKNNGFRWAPTVGTGAWQRQLSNHAIYQAREILKKLSPTGFYPGSINDEAARLAAHG